MTLGSLASPQVLTTDSRGIALANGTSYSVVVRAVNAVGNGADSAAATATPSGLPAQPIGTWSPGDGSVIFTLNSAPNTGSTSNNGSSISSYQYSTDGGSTWATAAWVSNSTIVTVPGLVNGQQIAQIQLRAVNGNGFSTSTTAQSVTPGSAAPAPSLSVLGGSRTLTVTITPTGTGGYPINHYEWKFHTGSTWTSIGLNQQFSVNTQDGSSAPPTRLLNSFRICTPSQTNTGCSCQDRRCPSPHR